MLIRPTYFRNAPATGGNFDALPHRPRVSAAIGDQLSREDYLSPHVQVHEVACRCGCGYGTRYGDIDDELLAIFECLRSAIGGLPILITSGARCIPHNRSIGGAPQSLHTQGLALDIRVPYGERGYPSREEMVELAIACNPSGGVGHKAYAPAGLIHIDTGPRRIW